MADLRVSFPSNSQIRDSRNWTQVADNTWVIDRAVVFCHDEGGVNNEQLYHGPPLDAITVPVGSEYRMKHSKQLSAVRTVRRGTIRNVIRSLKTSGGLSAEIPLVDIKLTGSADVADEESTATSEEDSLAITEILTSEVEYSLPPGKTTVFFPQYRRRITALYLEFEDHLEITYYQNRLRLARRVVEPAKLPGVHDWTRQPNVQDRFMRPLGTVSYWELVGEPDHCLEEDYRCEVVRPYETSWSPQPGRDGNFRVWPAREDDLKSLYDLVDYRQWRAHRPPRFE